MAASDTYIEYDYLILEKLEQQPDISQRHLAKHLGVSVGKVNYVLAALIERGLVRATGVKKPNNKAGYRYVLTPQGVSQKAVIARKCLNGKLKEYDQLKAQIDTLTRRLLEWE